MPEGLREKRKGTGRRGFCVAARGVAADGNRKEEGDCVSLELAYGPMNPITAEISAPEGYELDNTRQTVDWNGREDVTLTFRNLGILYQRTVDGKSGKYDILVDGERAATIDGHFPNGWGNAITATEGYTTDVSGEHRVTVRAAQGHEGKLILLGFLTSD